ncbi:hypothetical protein V8E53_002810 [Lactarius tabidus]
MGTKLLSILHVDWFTIDTQSYNSLDQNPCTVSAYLLATCYGGVFDMNPLLLGDSGYAGPSIAEAAAAGPCWCNTVTYNLASACSECQGGQSILWSEYYQYCSTILPPATFPNPVPAGTSVPQWALLGIPSTNYWSPTSAQRVGDFPELFPGALINTPAILPTTSIPPYVPAPTSPRSVVQEPTFPSLSITPLPTLNIPSSAGASSGVTLNPNSFAGCVTTVAAIAGVILSLFS